jgi:3-hydroxyisobutyrate dehydrogenase
VADGDAAGEAAVAPGADLAANFNMGASAPARRQDVNQAIVGTTYVLMVEVLALAEASGIDAARLPQCRRAGTPTARCCRVYLRMQARGFEPLRAYARQPWKDVHAVEDFVSGLG